MKDFFKKIIKEEIDMEKDLKASIARKKDLEEEDNENSKL